MQRLGYNSRLPPPTQANVRRADGALSKERRVYRLIMLGAIVFLSIVAVLVLMAPTTSEHPLRHQHVKLRNEVRYQASEGEGAAGSKASLLQRQTIVGVDESLLKNGSKQPSIIQKARDLRSRNTDAERPVQNEEQEAVDKKAISEHDSLVLGGQGCGTVADAIQRLPRAGEWVVRFVRSKPSASSIGHLPIAELTPIVANHQEHYFPSDSLIINNASYDKVKVLSASMRVVAASASESAGVTPLPRVTCDAQGFQDASKLSWSAVTKGHGGGDDPVSVVDIAFRPMEPHGSLLELTFRDHDVALYGFASRGAGVRLRPDEEIQLKNLDVNHYALDPKANLYGSIPLVYAVDLTHPQKYTFGILWLNGAALHIGTQRGQSSNDGISKLHLRSDGGTGRLYVLPGPTAADVLAQYYALTGFPVLPPLFGLGYHQCRWSYRDQADVLQVNDNFDEHHIPMDTIWLDIDHTNDRRYFTWNGQKFPDSKGMIQHLVSSGRKLVTITDPHIKVDRNYHVYRGAHDQQLFISNNWQSNEEFHGHCWPGESAWLDFANPKTREWYASLFDPSVYQGSTLDVFSWIDMNEPSVFSGPEITMPMDAGQFDGTRRYPHRELHNMYGFHHSAATFAGHLLRSKNQQRPFLLTRSFFAGSQRFAAVWTGDNQAQWSHLHGSVAMLMMHSLSGIVFIGADVGGFFDNPDDELHVRWYQLGCLYPFFRGHSHEETRRREPWLFSEPVKHNIAAAIRFRYELLPYLYWTFFESHRHGKSIWRPRMLEFPLEDASYDVDGDESILIGRALLAVPALHRGQTTTTTRLPEGSAFVDYWTGDASAAGSQVHFVVPSALQQPQHERVVPLMIRAGSVLPTLCPEANVRSSLLSDGDPIRLIVALNEHCTAVGYMYHDDGASTQFAVNGAFRVRVVTALVERGDDSFSLVLRSSAMEEGATAATAATAAAEEEGYRFMNVSRVRVMTALCPAMRSKRDPSSIEISTLSNATSMNLLHSLMEIDANGFIWDAKLPSPLRSLDWVVKFSMKG